MKLVCIQVNNFVFGLANNLHSLDQCVATTQ